MLSFCDKLFGILRIRNQSGSEMCAAVLKTLWPMTVITSDSTRRGEDGPPVTSGPRFIGCHFWKFPSLFWASVPPHLE